MLKGQAAAEEVLEGNRVADQASNVELRSLEVCKTLNPLVALVASQESTQYVEENLMAAYLDPFEAFQNS